MGIQGSRARRILPLLTAVLVIGSAPAWSATLRGDLGGDRLLGTARTDRIVGGSGDDRLFGRDGADVIAGGGGNDHLRGGDGRDRLDGGPGRDRLLGGDGRDRLEGGGGADVVICGDGEDTVVADLADVVAADCEHVARHRAKAVGSARERPFPLGVAAPTVDGWDLQVVSFVADATASVNALPAGGKVFSIARVRATRTASGPDTFDGSFRLGAVGPAGVVNTTFENSCTGLIPDPISNENVSPGGTIEGNVCWSVRSKDVGSLVLVDEPSTGDRLQFWAFR